MDFKKQVKERILKYARWNSHVRYRENIVKKDLAGKKGNIKAELTKEETAELEKIWKGYLNKDRLKWFELYKTLWPGRELKYFVPDDFYYMYVDEYFTKKRGCGQIDDKNLYNMLFHDVPQPRTIARQIDGVLLSPDYQIITQQQFIDLCRNEGRVILKKSVESAGGKGVLFYDIEKDSDKKLSDMCENQRNFIAQEVMVQHSELARLHPESINTVRIMTFNFEDKVTALSSVVRMGVGDSKVDNASSGGIVCGINPDGSLKERAFDVKANRYDIHPSGTHFESVVIPHFDECIDLAKRLTPRFARYTRLISWDFAMNESGHPILIEANLRFGQVDFHQMCNGPIFGEMGERVVRYIMENNPLVRKG